MEIVLLRGLIREKRHWNDFPKALSKLLPDAKITQIEYPSAGIRHREKFPLNIKKLVDDLRSQLEEKNGARILVAISLGGMVALNWSKIFPNDFDKLVIINSSARNLSLPHERMNIKEWKKIFNILKTKSEFEKELAILEFTTNKLSLDQKNKIATQYASYAKECPITLQNLLRQLALATSLKAPKMNRDILFCVGDKDLLARPSCSKKMSDFYGSELRIAKDAGHDLSLDAPNWLAAEIRNLIV